MAKTDKQFARLDAIIGDEPDGTFQDAVRTFVKHLNANLQLPCEVTGMEDFRWEEPYVLGGFDEEEYEELKKTQPSFEDRYQLLSIKVGEYSEWMLCDGEDVAARVRRISDGKKFVLGLSELKATDKKSENFQLIDDFATFFWNYR